MKEELYADVILPLALKRYYTYRLPDYLLPKAVPGARAIVSFGKKKLYTGIIRRIHTEKPQYGEIKTIVDITDNSPVTDENHLKFWEWVAEYYMCTPGEVMKAAVPPGFCPESETILQVNPNYDGVNDLDETYLHLLNLIEKRKQARLKSLPAAIGNRNTFGLVNSMLNRNILLADERVKLKSDSATEKFVVLSRRYSVREMESVLDSLKKAPGQRHLLSAYLDITGFSTGSDIIPVSKNLLMKKAGTPLSSLASLEKKGILLSFDLETKPGRQIVGETLLPPPLSDVQLSVYASVKEQMSRKNVILIHGITSSGKTQIYIHLIKEFLESGKQVLYLLPEIALTTQIIERLRRHFGISAGIYHSRLSGYEKMALWKKVADDDPECRCALVLGVRSSVFLPFKNLGLIIVDEEHEASYKQQDPSPRYHARDSAIMLASLTGAVTILGSATPSVESYFNAMKGKYGFAEMKERYGKINMPEIILVNTREAYRKKLMISHFSPQLLDAIAGALGKKEQVLLFRNRRGFAPYLQCSECGWIPLCTRCSVNLTYHREINRIVCHYCGLAMQIPASCPSCGSLSVETRGFGTEKIEDEIKMIFPEARVARMDQDSTAKRNSFNKIIHDFENHNTDILIGTQMVSKGLDFENLTVVAILNADSMLGFPDFRSFERAFQLMAQVSGRAGRRQKHGKVIIQTTDPEHKILRFVIRNDYMGFYESQAEERKAFNYPPFCRLIKITLKHRDKKLLNEFAERLGIILREHFGGRVLGPEFPVISRIQLWYLKEILIKIERDKPLNRTRELVRESVDAVTALKGASTLRVSVDVDPY